MGISGELDPMPENRTQLPLISVLGQQKKYLVLLSI